MNVRNALHLALLTLILAGLLTACGPMASPTPTPTPTAPTIQGGGSLTVAIAADVDGLDPHKTVTAATFQITRNLYDTLVQVDPLSRIQPDLATSWETSDDGLKWTFHLRDDVSFHNGRTMTAADVKYSFERILNPDTASPRAQDYKIITTIDTPDDYAIVFTLSQPQAAFLSNLAYGWAAIVPQEAAETLRDHPVGSGPFQFVEWVPDSHVKLRRFDNYFVADVPYLDEVTFRVITDPPAHEMDIPLDAVAVTAAGDFDPRGVCGEPVDPRIQEFRVRLALSGPTEEQAEALAEAFRTRCPVYATLSRAAPIELEVAVEPPPPKYRKEQKMKVLRCRDVGFDCDGVVRAESEEELLRQVAEHAQTVHDVEVTPELVEQVKSLIRDE